MTAKMTITAPHLEGIVIDADATVTLTDGREYVVMPRRGETPRDFAERVIRASNVRRVVLRLMRDYGAVGAWADTLTIDKETPK